jgi:hypothetical protein
MRSRSSRGSLSMAPHNANDRLRGPQLGPASSLYKRPRKGSGPLPPHPDQLIQRPRQGALHPLVPCKGTSSTHPLLPSTLNGQGSQPHGSGIAGPTWDAHHLADVPQHPEARVDTFHCRRQRLEVTVICGEADSEAVLERAFERTPPTPHLQQLQMSTWTKGHHSGVHTARHRLGPHCCPRGCGAVQCTPQPCTS